MAPGAFFVLAGLTAIQNKMKMPSATNGSKEDELIKEEIEPEGDSLKDEGEEDEV